MHSIEPLESRIAPATLTGNVLTYTDADGDAVTITFKTKGALTAANFTFDTAFADAGPQQLRLIDFAGGVAFAKANIAATVVQQGAGNGKVNIGHIDAQGLDLGKVIIAGDLGRITAGDAKVTTAGLALLDVGSLGAAGVATQIPGGDLESVIVGKLGSLVIAGDVDGASLNVTGGSKVGIGKISVGGSLRGGADSDSGSIQTQGNIGKVTIGGDLEGTLALRTGQLFAGGKIAAVTVGGSLKGGDGDDSGSIFAGGNMGAVVVTGGLIGGGGSESGQIDSNGALKSATVGFIKGGVGPDGGGIDSDGNTAFVTVLGNVEGGAADEAGLIDVDGNLGKLTIEGAIKGGSVGRSGVEVGDGNLGTAVVKMGIEGGAGEFSGSITAFGAVVKGKLKGGKIGKLTITGSLTGGAGENSGYVGAAVIGTVEVTQNLQGGSAPDSGVVFGQLGLKKLTIDGSIIAGTSTRSGAVASNGPIGSVSVLVDITGTAAHHVSISGDAKQQGGVAIKSLTVGGNVAFADILAGYVEGTPVNASAQIGSVVVTGNFTASNIVAGVRDTNANGFGNVDDLTIAPDNSPKISSIAKIVIGGAVNGTAAGGDNFGFTAQLIKSLTIANTAVTLASGASNDLLLALPGVTTGDFTLNEVA